MADKTIEWLHAVRAQDAGKLFFTYFSTGCSHAPHHVAEAWAKYAGKFDQGWDKLREETFARQKELGVIPDAELTPRDEAFPAWDDVPKLKAYYARQMDTRRVLRERRLQRRPGARRDRRARRAGQHARALDLGDNGASMEGTITGSLNELTMQNGIPLTDEMQLQLAERYGGIEAWGNQMMAPHYSAAWAWASNTPFKWGKQVARTSAERAIPSWSIGRTRSRKPGGTADALHARHRRRSHDPRDRPDADPHRRDRAGTHARRDACRLADGRRRTRAPPQQYFETIGNRAMYKDGWWLR